MQRSSENIGTIAAALAKAQAELTNPEKSLVATIRTDVAGGAVERSFRYAAFQRAGNRAQDPKPAARSRRCRPRRSTRLPA